MSAATSASLIFILSVGLFMVVSAGQRNITAEPGDDVTLPCLVSYIVPIMVVKWSRPDLEPEYVLLYRDGYLDPSYQHPSFQQRVDLQDRQMKDGDVSLILKKVTTDDTGTYECRVFQTKQEYVKEGILKINSVRIIHLEVLPSGTTVEDGGDEDGRKQDGDSRHPGLIVVLVVILVLAVVMVGVGVGAWIKRKEVQNLLCTKTSSQRVSSASDDQKDQERGLSLMPFSD